VQLSNFKRDSAKQRFRIVIDSITYLLLIQVSSEDLHLKLINNKIKNTLFMLDYYVDRDYSRFYLQSLLFYFS